MSHKKSLSGKYIARSHTTTTQLVGKVVRFLNKSNLITKVTLGVINPKGSSSLRRLTLSREDHGLCILVHDSAACQELYVSAPDRELVINCLETWCQREGIPCTLR